MSRLKQSSFDAIVANIKSALLENGVVLPVSAREDLGPYLEAYLQVYHVYIDHDPTSQATRLLKEGSVN